MDLNLGSQTYTLGPKLFSLGGADFFPTTYTPTSTPAASSGTVFDRLLADDPWSTLAGIVKVATDPEFNDLLQNEQAKLLALSQRIGGTPHYAWVNQCIPEVIDHGTHRSKAVTVFRAYPEFVSFERLLQIFPKGLDYQDVVWMWKRFLATLWFTHQQGVVHGAVLPPNIFVHPTEHGPKLTEWGYAMNFRTPLGAIIGEYKDFYPPEVFRRRDLEPSVDLYMLAKCVLSLLGGNVTTNELPDTVPAPFAKCVLDCLHEDPSRRPAKAGDLHEEVDTVLKQLIGKPRYRPLVLP